MDHSYYSILIGAFSHLLWDSFTHKSSEIFDHSLPFLKKKIEILGIKTQLYSLFQYISSILGLIYIYYVVYKLPVNKNVVRNKLDKKFWLAFISITICFIAFRFILNQKILLVSNPLGNILVTCIMSAFISLIITPFLFKNK